MENQDDPITRRGGAVAKSDFHEFATQLDAMRKSGGGDSVKTLVIVVLFFLLVFTNAYIWAIKSAEE